MRSPAVFVAFVGVLILVGVFCIAAAALAGSSGRTRRIRSGPGWWRTQVDQARERRRRARRAAVPWVYYSRPNVESGQWDVGVERVLDLEVLDRQRITSLPLAPLDSLEVLVAEHDATDRAQQYNDARGARS